MDMQGSLESISLPLRDLRPFLSFLFSLSMPLLVVKVKTAGSVVATYCFKFDVELFYAVDLFRLKPMTLNPNSIMYYSLY